MTLNHESTLDMNKLDRKPFNPCMRERRIFSYSVNIILLTQ